MFTINLIKTPLISTKKTTTINAIIAIIRTTIRTTTIITIIIIIIQMVATIILMIKVNLKTVSRIKLINRDQEIKINNKIDQVAVLINNKVQE